MRKRSKYRPKPINPNAHLVAIQGAAWLSIDDQTKWALQIEEAVTAVARGKATKDDWNVIFDSVNLVEALVSMRRARDPHGVVRAAQEACASILDRRRETGVRAVRASELAALHDLRAGWVTLMSGITKADRFQAGELVERKKYHALAGGIPQAKVMTYASVE